MDEWPCVRVDSYCYKDKKKNYCDKERNIKVYKIISCLHDAVTEGRVNKWRHLIGLYSILSITFFLHHCFNLFLSIVGTWGRMNASINADDIHHVKKRLNDLMYFVLQIHRKQDYLRIKCKTLVRKGEIETY